MVLYPSETAISLHDFGQLIEANEQIKNKTVEESTFHVIIIDGTWSQASGIYYTNLELHSLKQVIRTNVNN